MNSNLLKFLCACLLFPMLCQADITLTEVSGSVGIPADSFQTATGHGLGVNWIDYDNDGWDDLFVVNGYLEPAHLYHNNGGTFSTADALLPPMADLEMMGSVFADYDNDGDKDIYIFTDHQDGPLAPPVAAPANLLLQNQWVENGNRILPGQPLFVEIAAQAGLQDLLDVPTPDGEGYRTATGGWVDYDRDGNVDLYACHWLGQTGGDPRTRDRLYRNQGDGTFVDVTQASGVNNGSDSTTFRPCLAYIAAHLDDDLWPDILVVNVGPDLPHMRDMLLQNKGTSPAAAYTDRALESPGFGDDSSAGMGVTVWDFELDGDWDIYISDLYEEFDTDGIYRGNPFYRHTGNGITYEDNSAGAANIEGRNSWGVNFVDLDQDGYEELFVSVMEDSINTNGDLVYQNNEGVDFTDISMAAGIDSTQYGRGSAIADFDRDGDMDIAVVNRAGGSLELYRNDTENAGNWLEIELIATESNRSAIGALVKVSAGGKNMMRQITGGSSAHSQDSLRLHFGLGAAETADSVEVYWPSGIVNDFSDTAANAVLQVTESGEAGLVSPVPGKTTLSGENILFEWAERETAGITGWALRVGTSVGASDIFSSGPLLANTTSIPVFGLPTNAMPVHVRLIVRRGTGAQTVDYVFTAGTPTGC